MTRWEYRMVPVGGRTPTSPGMSMLKSAGEEGWEAIALEYGHALCKRPIEPAPVPHVGDAE